MASKAASFVALLRGINVGGTKKVPMAELRSLCASLGWQEVETYIQSGNVVFRARGPVKKLEDALEAALAERFGFSVSVVVRDADAWSRYAEGTPFPDAEDARPNLLQLALSKRPPSAEAVATLRSAAKAGERVELVGDALWIDFENGIARSKLTPSVLDRATGSPVTARNWRTVQKLAAMLAAIAAK